MDEGSDWMVLWAILNSCKLSRSPISGVRRARVKTEKITKEYSKMRQKKEG
jgi:hypothetical protein